MDWIAFFERTRKAADVDSYAKLAPLIGVTDGAISHYRVGRSVPQVWVVADCLRIQGHQEPEKAAIEIMRIAARTQPERSFWKKLAAAAAMLVVTTGGMLPTPPTQARSIEPMHVSNDAPQAMHYANYELTERNVVDLALAQMVHDANTGTPPGLHGGICTNGSTG